jgi:hypothetical protein
MQLEAQSKDYNRQVNKIWKKDYELIFPTLRRRCFSFRMKLFMRSPRRYSLGRR